MPGPVLDVTSVMTCPHGGKVTNVPSQPRVLVNGQPALVLPDVGTVAGCAFTLPGGKPSPCVTVQWTAPATRVLASGQPVLVQSSVGLCKSPEQAPQGPAIISTVQPRVTAM